MLLQVNNLSCVREDRTLFEHLSFSVAPGDLVQIEGPNGVGKTSLLRLLTGLSQPFAGEVCWNGENIRHCRDEYHANLLYLGHQPGVKAVLTPFENLKFYQQLHHPQQTEIDLWQILARVGLAGFEENPTGQLSAGPATPGGSGPDSGCHRNRHSGSSMNPLPPSTSKGSRCSNSSFWPTPSGVAW